MGKNKVLVKVHPEGKYVVDIDKEIDIAKLTAGARVALRNDSYTLHICLPTKVIGSPAAYGCAKLVSGQLPARRLLCAVASSFNGMLAGQAAAAGNKT